MDKFGHMANGHCGFLSRALQWGVLAALLVFAPGIGQSRADTQVEWQILEPGLEYGEAPSRVQGAELSILRIDPAYFEFLLCASGRENSPPQSLAAWREQEDLIAAINASMYLPDGLTSTGYMRDGDYLNNGSINGRFGGFFVARPESGDLPQAMILEKGSSNWQALLDRYDLAIQNFRMVASSGNILWAPGGELNEISAIAEDSEGRILFVYAANPLGAHEFASLLMGLPIGVRSILYTEGGPQAGLTIDTGSFKRDFSGAHAPSLLKSGSLRAALPNVLGVRRRSGSVEKTFTTGAE